MDPFATDLFSVFKEKKSESNLPKRGSKRPNPDVEGEENPPPKKPQQVYSNVIVDLNPTPFGTTPLPPSYVPEPPPPTERPAKRAKTTDPNADGTTNEDEKDEKTIDCKHHVSIPEVLKDAFSPTDLIFNPLYPDNPAKAYPFTLDPFQRMSIACLERNESVLVSAHTSAGKTVVAEYAIAMSLRDKQRVVYTSPIKALSNQKYRELTERFGDVGLMTGDVSLNTTASCLVMTTEILRSMLYRGSEVMREVAWVIFDEIHYMRDKERGVVWEETLILLPDKVRYVFLSATIPNAEEFADWIASLHNQPCHVVYTDYRPTPLQHYIYPAGGDGLHLVVDEKGKFREDNFQKALMGLALSQTQGGGARGGRGGGRGGARGGARGAVFKDCYKIVKMVMDRQYDPVIIFSFAKRETESYALQMSKLDLLEPKEKDLVEKIFTNAVSTLSEDDRALPQVESLLPLLKRGVGIHHGGLLPILKEVIEILFQEGLIKALFATETFAMGVNMPAKTVIFTNVRKFDGESNRFLTPGEYIQMSGRAGRRGLDDRGIVIMMVDEKMEPAVAKNMVKGSSDALMSSFHLGYGMLLNLMRVEGVEPEYIIGKSFHQFQTSKQLPMRKKQAEDLLAEANAMVIPHEEVVEEYYQLRQEARRLKQAFRDVINQPVYSLPFIQPGRLVKVLVNEWNNETNRLESTEYGWGVIVNFTKKVDAKISSEERSKKQAMDSAKDYIVDVLLRVLPQKTGRYKAYPLLTKKDVESDVGGEFEVVPVILGSLDGISSFRAPLSRDLKTKENRRGVGKSIKELLKKFPEGNIPLLDPVEDLSIEDTVFTKLVRRIEVLEQTEANNPRFQELKLTPDSELLKQYLVKRDKYETYRELNKQIKSAEGTILKDHLACMKRVLRRLGFTDKDNIIQIKGRVACEINAADELLITELMFNGVLNNLDPECLAALVSCFVEADKADATEYLQEKLQSHMKQIEETARKIALVSQECKIPVDPETYVMQLKPQMMDVVYSWCTGSKFAEICKLTNNFEGSIIRCMRRLEELLRELGAASKAIGNSELEAKFENAITKIRRDIVFAVSLYT
eukprot:TRINITY_DN886_c1_g2_i1.p1 TRINITY_DN886_c1_g2~~TRINITY_DN886_c1_g2_i1.p1  ORF type:complete len:1081 (-),score=299.92 TRINITY_DN886_c1_g2_i1:45-3287(-)